MKKLGCVMSRDACAYLRQGGQDFLYGHIYVYVCSSRGRLWSSNSFPEEQCLACWSVSNAMGNWRSVGVPPEKFSRTKLSTTPENAPSQDKRDGKSSMKDNSCPSCVGVPGDEKTRNNRWTTGWKNVFDMRE